MFRQGLRICCATVTVSLDGRPIAKRWAIIHGTQVTKSHWSSLDFGSLRSMEIVESASVALHDNGLHEQINFYLNMATVFFTISIQFARRMIYCCETYTSEPLIMYSTVVSRVVTSIIQLCDDSNLTRFFGNASDQTVGKATEF